MTVAPVTFREFFESAWGRAPFAWQERLAARVADQGWPDVLDLPTGVGKTAAIDVAVWHLAVTAAGVAPRRILFVVDRRIVVDAAFERADALATRLRDALPASPLGIVAARLRDLAGVPGVDPLQAARLRGGVPREPDWAGAPTQPVVAVSTVDQVGSRLLFRGYGVSPSMLPVQAGLVGHDALILLDEAHLSEPFRQTLAGLAKLRPAPRDDLPSAPWHHVTLSATPGAVAEIPFSLLDDDWESGPLASRLLARKRAVLVAPKAGEEAFVAAITAEAERLSAAGKGKAFATLVVVNRVASARSVHSLLAQRVGGKADVELVIGRARPLDRERRSTEWLPRVRAGRDDGGGPRDVGDCPLLIVATQCVEAGADLDADALVTESAPLDALRQRFGRLDRLGRLPHVDTPRAAIVHRPQKKDDPIYGEAIAYTWQWLTRLAGAGEFVDFGLSEMRRVLADTPADAMLTLLAPKHDAPVLVPGHLEAWVETSPPSICPAPSLFLHGPRGTPDVTLVWRRDIATAQLQALGGGSHEFPSLEAIPPSALEAITLSPWAVKAWLARSEHPTGVLTDLEGVDGDEESRDESHVAQSARLALRRTDANGWEVIDSRAVQPGDLLVVPADAGGCDAFGWNPDAVTPVDDVAETAHRLQRGQWALRLPATEGSRLAEAFAEAGDDPTLLRRALNVLGALPDDAPEAMQVRWYRPGHPESGAILLERRGRVTHAFSEDDRGSFEAEPVTLDAHLQHVEAWASRFADVLPLTSNERRALSLAAAWHDVGKADLRFQAMLRGEPRLSRFDDRPAIAKGAVPWDPWARVRAGLPAGWRHEVSSVAMAAETMGDELDEVRDLALWLIATHHGRGRPFFDDVPDAPAPAAPVRVAGSLVTVPTTAAPAAILADHVERFERQVEWHGPHRLAWLEAILRLADHRASAVGAPEVE